MTSREFIEKWYGVNDGQSRRLSSIEKDGGGNIFSYGSHYPLMFRIAGIDFINVKGYSVTTAKHIAWARSAANRRDIQPIAVRLTEQIYLTEYNIDANLNIIQGCLTDDAVNLQRELLRKTRTDTKLYAQLSYEAGLATGNLKRLQELRGVPTN